MYLSTIFRTITTDLDGAINKIGIFNKSFADFKNALGVTHIAKELDKNGKFQYESTKNGIGGLLNSLSFGITEKDILNIKKYNRLVGEEGVSSQTAWYQTIMSSSKAAQSLFDNEKNFIITENGAIVSTEALTVAQNTMTLSTKAATVATKALAIAGNMIAMWAISEVISIVAEKIDDLIHSAQNASEAMDELASESRYRLDELQDEADTIKDLISKYEELANSETYDSSTHSEIKDIQEQITELVGTQANNLDLVNDKLDEELEKLRKIAFEEASETLDQVGHSG